MSEINIANSAGRDALVGTISVTSSKRIRWLDEKGRQASSARILKSPIECDGEALVRTHGSLADLGKALLSGDPEIDFERTGKILQDTSRVYIDDEQKVVHKVQFFESIFNPDGSPRERRPQKALEPNLNSPTPLRWSGVFIKKADACRRFVFSGKVQLQHVNGLTYDFLFGMAKELEEKASLLLLGAGPKSKEPLILRRAGTPYRGFLEGKTQGALYNLTLHFSNLELKAPAVEKPS